MKQWHKEIKKNNYDWYAGVSGHRQSLSGQRKASSWACVFECKGLAVVGRGGNGVPPGICGLLTWNVGGSLAGCWGGRWRSRGLLTGTAMFIPRGRPGGGSGIERGGGGRGGGGTSPLARPSGLIGGSRCRLPGPSPVPVPAPNPAAVPAAVAARAEAAMGFEFHDLEEANALFGVL